MNKDLFAKLAIASMMAATNEDFYRLDKKIKYPPNGGNGFSDKIPKAVDSRQLREFSIKGHKVMAYSRKDAITRLKHQKKI